MNVDWIFLKKEEKISRIKGESKIRIESCLEAILKSLQTNETRSPAKINPHRYSWKVGQCEMEPARICFYIIEVVCLNNSWREGKDGMVARQVLNDVQIVVVVWG